MPPPWQRAAAAAPSIALLALFALVVLVGLTAAEIPCHYCGHQDLCPLPYIDKNRPESADSVKLKKMCPKACLKFDGYAPDGKRVIIRDCAAEGKDTNECEDLQEYSGASGQMCVCNAANCNEAATTARVSGSVGAVLFGSALATVAYMRWRAS